MGKACLMVLKCTDDQGSWSEGIQSPYDEGHGADSSCGRYQAFTFVGYMLILSIYILSKPATPLREIE